ncbi:portal protein [Ruegeria sp. EL01]|uniref:portal protein n=1 Tax=Ruegeria sp. EL01 TaxID=2107578 RepID=UPI000EA82CAF|nr:portal protein [Ruegeria sp. EL01]
MADDEFKQRFSVARAHRRQQVEEDGREIYKFCFNGREQEWDDRTKYSDDPEEIFTEAAATVAEEFYGELFSTMTPENSPWTAFEAGNAVDEDQKDAAEEQLGMLEKKLAKALRSSNYYDEGPTAFQDAVVGNIAMWMDRPSLISPIVCEAVPLPELFLTVGPRGLEDRFRRQSYHLRDLKQLFPDADFPRALSEKIKNGKSGQAKVIWGFWRNYEDVENPKWRQEIRVDGKAIGMDEDLGEEGSQPLIVGRYNPYAKSAWGRGPGRRMLPTLRGLDELVRMNLEGMDRTLDPAFVYPHDGILDLSEGIDPGLGYPSMPGSAENVRPLDFGNLDYGFFSEERIEQKIREGFYREIEQRGKTPPSASQYVGQENKQVRRMARPAAKTWREFGVGLLRRVEYLERQAGGSLDGVKLPLLDDRTVIARPISPLERSQALQDVTTADSIVGMVNERLGPEQAAILVDGPKTYRNIKEKLKDEIVEFRSKEEITEMIQAMQPQQAPNEQ